MRMPRQGIPQIHETRINEGGPFERQRKEERQTTTQQREGLYIRTTEQPQSRKEDVCNQGAGKRHIPWRTYCRF